MHAKYIFTGCCRVLRNSDIQGNLTNRRLNMKMLIKPKQLSEIEKNLDGESLRNITGGAETCTFYVSCQGVHDPCPCKVS